MVLDELESLLLVSKLLGNFRLNLFLLLSVMLLFLLSLVVGLSVRGDFMMDLVGVGVHILVMYFLVSILFLLCIL